MFTNVGRKIKTCAIVVFGLVSIGLIIFGIKMIEDAIFSFETLTGIAMIILGPIWAWVTSIFVYGFGELVEKVCSLEKCLTDSVEERGEKTKIENFMDSINDRVTRAAREMTKPAAQSAESAQNMKKCSKCGTLLPENALFCTKCGQKVE